MNILIGTVALFALATWVWQKLETSENRRQAFAGVRGMLLSNLPRLIVALVSAGFFAELLPEEFVRQYFGDASGIRGVLLGTISGVLTPGGAFVSFALAAGAAQAGATTPALVAYLSAWSLFGLTKIITEELAFLGPRFLLQRIAVTCPIPIMTGALALWVS